METEEVEAAKGAKQGMFGNKVKIGFALGLALMAAIAGYFTIIRDHPAETTLRKALEKVEEGDLEGMMKFVDPEGQFGVIWNENTDGARDTLTSLLDEYRVDFDSVACKTRSEGNNAEVELTGGRVNIYNRGDTVPFVFFDLKDSDIVFYLEKKGDSWLIEGTNYDLSQVLSGEQLPFQF